MPSKLTKTVIAWDAGNPVYATEAQLDWRERAAKQRAIVEANPNDKDALQEYYDILTELPLGAKK